MLAIRKDSKQISDCMEPSKSYFFFGLPIEALSVQA